MPRLCQRVAEQTDIGTAKDLPDRTDHIPRDKQRQCHQHEADGNAPAFARHIERNDDAQRNLDRKDDEGEDEIAPERGMKAFGVEDFVKPFGSGPEELVVAECILHRIIDHGHQRDDGRKSHEQQHRQDHEPGFVVPGFFHGYCPPTRQLSA